jgi:DNA repair exonuclease SbcCD ATPase subunit
MKVSKLEVTGFGKLVDAAFAFGPGINLILGENESGKSTLQQALLAALYGFYEYREAKGRRPPAEAELEERHAPWQRGAPYGTAIEYELDGGRRLRLERRFAGNGSTLQVHDVGRGEQVAVTADRYGGLPVALQEQYLGAKRAVFTGSACVDQGKLSALGDARSLSEAMVKALDSDEADVSARDALKLLDDTYRKAVGSDRARSTELLNARKELVQARKALADWDAARDAVDGDVREEAALAAAVESLRGEVERLQLAKTRRQVADLDEVLRRLDQVEPHLSALDAEQERLAASRTFDGPSQAEVTAARVYLQRARADVRHLAARQADEAEQVRTAQEQQTRCEGLAAAGRHLASFPTERQQEVHARHAEWVVARERLAAAREQSPVAVEPAAGVGGFSLPVFLLGALVALVLAAAGVAFRALVPGLVLAALALIVAAAMATRRGPAAQPAPTRRISPDTSALELAERAARQRLEATLAAAGIGGGAGDEAVQRFDAAVGEKRSWEEAERGAEQARQALTALAGHDEELRAAVAQEEQLGHRFAALMAAAGVAATDPEEADRQYGERLAAHQRCAEVEQQVAAARRERYAIASGRPRAEIEREREQAAQRLGAQAGAAPADGRPLPQLDEALAQATAKHHEADRRLAALRDRVARGLPTGPGRGEREEGIVGWEQEVERLECFGAALQLARECLEEAARDAREDFVPRLRESTSSTVRAITGGHYDSVLLSFTGADLGISLSGPDTPASVAVTALSAGTVEQCYIGLRLAIASLLSQGGERLPLILDDPFVNADRPRLQRLLAFLVELAREHQILFFSKDESLPAWFAAATTEAAPVTVIPMDAS